MNDVESLLLPMEQQIQEMALFRYSGRPQYNTFETLHFDILFSETAVENTHPLVDASLDVLPGKKTFKERHGYEIPKDVL